MLGDVLSLPEKCGMLADSFDDFRLFGEQKLWLIFAGGHRAPFRGAEKQPIASSQQLADRRLEVTDREAVRVLSDSEP
jgi:hypothetical protein